MSTCAAPAPKTLRNRGRGVRGFLSAARWSCANRDGTHLSNAWTLGFTAKRPTSLVDWRPASTVLFSGCTCTRGETRGGAIDHRSRHLTAPRRCRSAHRYAGRPATNLLAREQVAHADGDDDLARGRGASASLCHSVCLASQPVCAAAGAGSNKSRSNRSGLCTRRGALAAGTAGGRAVAGREMARSKRKMPSLCGLFERCDETLLRELSPPCALPGCGHGGRCARP